MYQIFSPPTKLKIINNFIYIVTVSSYIYRLLYDAYVILGYQIKRAFK